MLHSSVCLYAPKLTKTREMMQVVFATKKEKSRGLTHGGVGPLLVISYELALLELRTSLLELLAMLVGGKLLEVLDKALSQILSLRLPLSGISVGVSWI